MGFSQVTDSIHELMGNTSAVGSKTSQAHVSKIFETMDLNHDGKITLDEFVTYCTTKEDVRQSLTVFLELVSSISIANGIGIDIDTSIQNERLSIVVAYRR